MDILEFINKVKGYRDEEAQASKEYEEFASYARGVGLSEDIVDKIKDIALDENGHYRFFETLHNRLQIPTVRPSTAEKRPFPQTYGEWVNLAADIKGAIGATPAGWDAINYRMQIIASGEGDVDDAKRWLVNKAGELGIT